MSTLERVRRTRPLVHAITNYVTMDWVARGLLAAGARPVMARDRAEAGPMAAQASALLLNLGTWSSELHLAMLAAGQAANAQGVPIVFDPVGAGGLATRTEAALEILSALRVTAIRGNAGEIAALTSGAREGVRGVDAVGIQPGTVAKAAARKFGCIVAATGPIDVVSDGQRTLEVKAGHPLLAQVPGAGCLASALMAAALAGADERLSAAADALLWLGAAGEMAGSAAGGPGSFAVTLLDSLASLSALPEHRVSSTLAERLSLYVIASGTTPIPVLEQVLAAGVKTIQFREKRLPLAQQVGIARHMRERCHAHGALFLVNDRVDLAQAVSADGVHLGQDDLPVAEARRILGPGAVIGGTCETAEEARMAQEQGADYIGTGPVYATPSKADAGDPYGPAVVERVSRAVHIPVVGIGGIGPGQAAPVIRAGGCGVAVISAVVGAPDPRAAALALLEEVCAALE